MGIKIRKSETQFGFRVHEQWLWELGNVRLKYIKIKLIYYNILLFAFFLMAQMSMRTQAGKIIRQLTHSQIRPNSISKLVTISPGGYRGFYLLGVSSYIRSHFNTDQCLFSGASVGAWIALGMTYRGNYTQFIHSLNVLSPQFTDQPLGQMQRTVSDTIMRLYRTEDFDLDRLFIGVTRVQGLAAIPVIYSNFSDLKDAVECCKASSHIPLITGNLLCKYDGQFALDGGICPDPYLKQELLPELHIFSEIWVDEPNRSVKPNFAKFGVWKNIRLLLDQTTLFSRYKYNLDSMFRVGYEDSAANHEYLAQVFLHDWRCGKK